VARRYYYPEDKTSLLERARNRVFRKAVPDFPKTMVIETQSGCNARCVFCSYPKLRTKLPRGRMSAELFEKLAKDCAGRPVERFILCLDNEPLLDPEIAERFAALRRHCPKAVRNLTTNASLLTPEKVEQLIGSGLVTELFLSINGDSKEVYEKLMGLPYEQVMANVMHLCNFLQAHRAAKRALRVRVNTVRTKLVAPEIAAMRRRWESAGFEFHEIVLDSRGDDLDTQSLAGERMEPNTSCRRLFHTMVITWEGYAVLCCVDYKRAVKLGDVREQPVYEIWNGPWATLLRKEYLAGDLTHLPICRTCRIGT
jgi:MoaA/NifB/PqqE/SkfB family radical SAM enzyme